MKRRSRFYYIPEHKAIIWDRSKQDDSLYEIARMFDRYHYSIMPTIHQAGGYRPSVLIRTRPNSTMKPECCAISFDLYCHNWLPVAMVGKHLGGTKFQTLMSFETGKTVAYSLPLISLVKDRKKSLIITTAIVALQEQIIIEDFPDIRKNSGLDFTYDIAKGKDRYFCKLRADKDSGRSMSLFGFQDASVDMLLQQFDNKSWNGDKDYYPNHIDEDVWQRVNAKSGQCLNQDCPYYDDSPFFKARSKLDSVDVIITNHDMLFSDLSLGGGIILPSPSESIYVFDEGHHLTEKASSQGAVTILDTRLLSKFYGAGVG